MTERSLEEYNLAAETYYTRFLRIITEIGETVTAWGEFRHSWTGRIPPEFLVDEAPMLLKFISLYDEFKECMIDIGENQKTLAVHTKKYMDNQKQQIESLEKIIKIQELQNEINEEIIKSLEPKK